MFDGLLLSLGITTPILIALAGIIYSFLKGFLEKNLELYKERTLEKYKDEMIIKNIEFKHSLSVEFDKMHIIHDRQKEVLTSILFETNSIIVKINNSYDYEKSNYPLFSDSEYIEVKNKVYSNGLFVNTDSLKLINVFFEILQNITDWNFDAIGPEEDMNFNEFDISFLEVIQNEIFFRFRCQLGIDEKIIGDDYSEIINVIKIMCKCKDLFNETIIYNTIFYRKNEIYQIMKEIEHSKLVREKIKIAFESAIKKDEIHRYSDEDIDIILKYFNK